MSIEKQKPKTAKTIDIPAPEGVDGVVITQSSTRAEGFVELGEVFSSNTIDYEGVLDHLGIHSEGQVAGSQFNGEVFEGPSQVVDLLQRILPENLQYDQHGRVEITASFEGDSVGYSGVVSLSQIQQKLGAAIESTQEVRMPGGEPAIHEGQHGAWYPEMSKNPESGSFEVALNPDGSIKNPQGKFEPLANVAYLGKDQVEVAMATSKITVIIQKNPETGQPIVLTIFPGENAPAFPAEINTEAYSASSLPLDSQESQFWKEHVFIKTAAE